MLTYNAYAAPSAKAPLEPFAFKPGPLGLRRTQLNNQEVTNMNKHMKIVVIGGSGLIGTKLVNNLRQDGHEVVAGSPSTGVNTITGEGLADTLAGAEVVVDVANAPVWEDKAVLEFFETSGRNLLAAEAVLNTLDDFDRVSFSQVEVIH